MRRVVLLGSGLALIAALGVLWTYRFERTPGWPVWQLADFRAAAPQIPGVEWAGPPDHPALRMRVDADHPPAAARLAIPGMPAVARLHLRFRLTSRGLIPGREPWADGRLLVEWHPPDGGAAWENNPCASIRYDNRSDLAELVIRPQRSPAVPALRMEHLGRAGEFDLTDVQITVVQERTAWQIGRWFLGFGWLAWGVAWIRSWPGIRWWRTVAASAIWLLMGMNCVVPGPWQTPRAMAPGFQIGEGRARPAEPAHAAMAAPAVLISSGALPALGEMPGQGSWLLRVKLHIAQARAFLHALLLFGPALAMACLVGRRPALTLAVMLAIAIELAEIAFGFGFGWDDALDLFNDGIGIALALWVYQKTRGRHLAVRRIWPRPASPE